MLTIITFFLVLTIAVARYMVGHDKGEREPRKALWLAFLLGSLGLALAGFLEYFLLPDPDHDVHTLGGLALVMLGVGAIEELCKFVPLVLVLYKKRYFNEHTDGVIYFALAGMGFGLPENIGYTLGYGAGAGLVRLILTPVFHAATTGLIGYAVARAKLDKWSKYKVALVVLLAIGAHGLYDFGLYSGIGGLQIMSVAITIGMSINLFVLYQKATTLDRRQGLSVVGSNSFCRSCGFPNPKHNLYCSQCGNHA